MESARFDRGSNEPGIFCVSNNTTVDPPGTEDPSLECRGIRSEGFQPDERSALYPQSPDEDLSSRSGAHRKSRANLLQEPEHRSSGRRASVQSSGRSRANSCSRAATPLGDGRRAGCRKSRPRRASAARRKDSVRPARTEVRQARKAQEEARELEQARRHRRIAMIILGTFLFLLAASVLVVVVTLTHSSFQSPVHGPQELAEHRAQLRRENEELLNSLNRDSFVPENATVPP